MSYDHIFVIDTPLTYNVACLTCNSMSKERKMVVFNMRVPPETVAVIDELRRQEKDIPTRSEMARRCIEIVAKTRKVNVER